MIKYLPCRDFAMKKVIVNHLGSVEKERAGVKHQPHSIKGSF